MTSFSFQMFTDCVRETQECTGFRATHKSGYHCIPTNDYVCHPWPESDNPDSVSNLTFFVQSNSKPFESGFFTVPPR